jgi:hypothetical protein
MIHITVDDAELKRLSHGLDAAILALPQATADEMVGVMRRYSPVRSGALAGSWSAVPTGTGRVIVKSNSVYAKARAMGFFHEPKHGARALHFEAGGASVFVAWERWRVPRGGNYFRRANRQGKGVAERVFHDLLEQAAR